MELRYHPLMSRYGGIHNWPPAWVWISGKENKHPKGEVGVLRDVRLSMIPPRCYLVIEFDEADYMGCLLFDDRAFCLQVYHLLKDHCGEPIQTIAELDLSHTL